MRVTALSVWRSIALLCQASCSKSSLCAYLHVLLRLWRIIVKRYEGISVRSMGKIIAIVFTHVYIRTR